MNKQFKVIIVSFSFITALIISTGYSNLKRIDKIEKSIEDIQVDVNALVSDVSDIKDGQIGKINLNTEFATINSRLERLESQYRSLEDRIKTLEDNIFLKLQ